MELNYTKKLNNELLKISINKKIEKNTTFVLTFKKSDLSKVIHLIKEEQLLNIQSIISTDVVFNNENHNYLLGCETQAILDEILNDLSDLDTETFVISFTPTRYVLLNNLLTGTEKEITKKICLYTCHSSKFLNKANDYSKKLLLIDSDSGITIISEKYFFETLLNTHPKINNKMRSVFNQYIVKYSEKMKYIDETNKILENLLENY